MGGSRKTGVSPSLQASSKRKSRLSKLLVIYYISIDSVAVSLSKCLPRSKPAEPSYSIPEVVANVCIPRTSATDSVAHCIFLKSKDMPKLSMCRLVLLAFFVSVCLCAPSLEHRRVAIIGGGIGGTYFVWLFLPSNLSSAAYFLHKLSSQGEVEIDLFEKNARLGGRIHSVEFAGQMIELGVLF